MPNQDFHQLLNIVTPRKTTSSSVDTNIKKRKEEKWGKKKIQVGSMMTSKVGETKEKERMGRSRRLSQ